MFMIVRIIGMCMWATVVHVAVLTISEQRAVGTMGLRNIAMEPGPAIAIGELGDCLGRQMGWGRPLVSPLDLLPNNHSENNKHIKTCLLIMIILGRPFSHTFTCQPDF